MIERLKTRMTTRGIRKAYALLLPYLRTRRRVYAALLLLVLLDTALTLTFAWFLGRLTDAAVGQRFGELYGLIPLGIATTALTITSGLFTNRLEFAATSGIKRELSEHLLKHIMLLPAGRTDALHSGELLTHFHQDIHSMGGMIGSRILDAIRLPLIFTAVVLYLFRVHWLMALLGLLFVPVALLAGGLLGYTLRQKTRHIHDKYGNLNRLLTETLQGLPVIRSFVGEAAWFRKYTSQNGELYKLQESYVFLQGFIRGGTQAAGGLLYLLSFCLGAYFVSSGEITIGSLLAFVSLSGHLLYPLTGLAGLWMGIQEASTAVDRIASVLEEPVDSEELPSPVAASRSKSIVFRNVTFGYDKERPVIHDLSLTINAGQTVAIVGASGAGKSTLLHLLQGFYKPQAGSIRINGRLIDALPQAELRSQFALVAQDTFLFSATIRENLLLACPEATQLRLVEAARQAHIHDYILSLPAGYDTRVGERGVTLSGGQRQRLAIARALLRDAPILLLDEATSSLDSATEYEVKRSLEQLMAGRTTLMIAHRLSTIAHADLILVLDKGRVVQAGRHAELAVRPGPYRHLKQLQQMQEMQELQELPESLGRSEHG